MGKEGEPCRPDAAEREPELLTLLSMHECRHTFASLLIDTGGNPKAIQEVMGTPRSRRPSTSTGTFCPAATTTFGRAWTPTWLPPSDFRPADWRIHWRTAVFLRLILGA